MRLKPILAIAALAVAIAGCSTSPQAGIIAPQTAPAATTPRVQLDLQGVGKGTISASRLNLDTGEIFEIDRSDLSYVVVYIVPKGTELPEDASIVYYLNDANGDGVYPEAEVSDDEPEDGAYTHVVYRFDDLRDAEIAWMQVRFEAEGYAAGGTVASSGSKFLAMHRFGEAEASRNAMPFLSFAPGAPATLRFAVENWDTDALELVETLDVDYELYYDTITTHRLELDLSLTTQDDKPLLGLKRENVDLLRFDVFPDHGNSGEPQLDLAHRGNGIYTLGFDFRHDAVPTTVDVALSLRNTPMIRDVEY